MSLSNRLTLKELFQHHQRIQVPMIQRDYAQGRPAAREVRKEFLITLHDALQKPADDPTLPLNLDFIYGSVEGGQETRFQPLDGQQRLTTLFLLHWYLAWQEEAWDEFAKVFRAESHSRFAYGVRPSSNEFFDALVRYQPDVRPENVTTLRRLLTDQSWYFRSWRLDPTIQSVLNMLDDIHARFAASNGFFQRLMDETNQAITFQLLELENFGLSDDLYIKMNARGKPLTAFENFKARYEQALKSQLIDRTFSIEMQHFPVAEYVALRLDNAWADLFWKLRDKKSNLFDSALMNVFQAVALVTRNPESKSYADEIGSLRSVDSRPSFRDFDDNHWLDEKFTLAVIYLLDAWSACTDSGTLTLLLPDSRYFDEKKIFDQIVSGSVSLTYTELIQFNAYVSFIAKYAGSLNNTSFQEWMRLVKNLSLNSEYNRVDDFQRSIRSINQLLDQAGDILRHFADTPKPVTGFYEKQIAEETLKARLILAHDDWRELIDRAESHGYFQGQIEFLLDFSGVLGAINTGGIESLDEAAHHSHQKQFEDFLRKADFMFTSSGLKHVDDYQWERALLCKGDYLLSSGRNWSFLIDSATEPTSWKRFLRGTGVNNPGPRTLLRDLWSQIDLDQDLPGQLDQIIASTAVKDAWRAAFIQTPAAIDYCWNRLIRWEDHQTVYLLQRKQMNGAHAELFTYCYYVNTLTKLCSGGELTAENLYYDSVVGIGLEPRIMLTLKCGDSQVIFRIMFLEGDFLTYALEDEIDQIGTTKSTLEALGFRAEGVRFAKTSTPTTIESDLCRLADAMATVPELKVTP